MQINNLVGRIRDAFAGMESGGLDFEAVAEVHEVLVRAIFSELRVACARFQVAYPEEAEREMREYYRRELGIEVSVEV